MRVSEGFLTESRFEKVKWTEEMVVHMLDLFDTGLNGTEIASVMSKKYKSKFTRGMIHGKYHRMKVGGFLR